MGLLYLFEQIRVPGLNEFMLLITQLGDETAFLVTALILFWCVVKRKGYYVMTVGFVGTIVNQMLKLVCRVPRPWVKDPGFTILEQAREGATGYSFPSGHATSAVGTFGSVAKTTKTAWVKWGCIAVAVLVPISRMYVGVHTFWDVLVGGGTSLILIFALEKPMLQGTEKTMQRLIGGVLALAVIYLAYVELWPFPADVDTVNLQHGVKNAYTLLGCMLGIAVAYPLERKWIHFETDAVWWVQILKAVLGLAVVLAVKTGLKAPLEALFAGHYASRAVRYFLIVVVAAVLWPMTFRWFVKLGGKQK